MKTRFKKEKVFDIGITAVAGMLSVAMMLYGVFHFGLAEAWLELVLNMFYIACLVMIWMYFFNRLDSHHFNYWCSVSVGITVLLRDVLFPPPLAFYALNERIYHVKISISRRKRQKIIKKLGLNENNTYLCTDKSRPLPTRTAYQAGHFCI